MKVIVGMATFKGREKALDKALESLHKQVDKIVLYDNEVNPDLTDNGKFYALNTIKEPCYYFTCDDDLLYPPDYVERTIDAIEEHKCIITHHGRILVNKDVSYYRGHIGFRCLDAIYTTTQLDVAGTGVTAFRTDYFNPKHLAFVEDKKMSDLVFSLEAIKKGKKIMAVPHSAEWIKHLPIDHSKTIHSEMSKKETRLIELANEIYDIKRNKATEVK